MRFSGKFDRRFPVCLDRDFRLLKPIIDGRNLGVVVILGEFRNMRGIPDRRIMVSGFPEAKMPQNLFDDFFVLDKADNFHCPLALWTQ